FLNFYGQNEARLYRQPSIYEGQSNQTKRSWLMSILSPILFYAPDVHLDSLNKIWVDRIAAKEPWNKFRLGRTSTRDASNVQCMQATILLNANIAFLDVPGVESGGPSQSLTQIFSYISTVLALGSAILGLVLGRHHHTKRTRTAVEASLFLSGHDLETTAIIYSLPYALLMYGSVGGE
ncbi:hypothetical protein C8R43DRAFT_871384, partial [Mycena crocata]